jgi:hypothetical protein
MKQRTPLSKATLLLAVLLTLGAAQVQADILPRVSVNFAPVGITLDQTARLNLLNADVPNGILVTWRFIDASGFTLAQSTVSLTMGKITSVDFRRAGSPLPPNTDPAALVRAEVRAQVEIITPNVPSEGLRRSLEVFNNDTGTTSVLMGGAAP